MVRFLLILFLLNAGYSGIMKGQGFTVPQKQVDLEREYIKGNQLKLLGKLDEALRIFEDITRKDKRNHAAYYELARIYESKEDWINAEKAIANAVRLNQEEPWYFIKQIDILEAQNKLEDAAAVFERLVPLRPDQQAFYLRWAQILSNAGDWNQAIKVLEEEEKVFGKNMDITQAKVEVLRKAGKEDEILQEWDKLHAAYPDKVEILKQKVDALVEFGRFDELKPVYQKILTLDPNDADTKVKLAKIDARDLSRQDQLDALLPMLEDNAVPALQKIKALVPFVESLASDPDSSFSRSLLDKGLLITQQYPENAMAHALVADIYNQQGDMKNAAQSYSRTVAIDVSNAVVWEQYLFALSETQQYDALYDRSEEAIDLFPNRAEFFLLHGTALMARGQWEDGADFSDQALIRAGRNTFIKLLSYAQMAHCYHLMGEEERRNEFIQRAISTDPNFLPVIKLYLGYALLDKQVTERWENTLEEASRKFPLDKTLPVFRYLAQLTQPDPAVISIENIPVNSRDCGPALEWVARWLESNDMKKEAMIWWKEAAGTSDFGPDTYYRVLYSKRDKQNN